jgi:hypothetical protein
LTSAAALVPVLCCPDVVVAVVVDGKVTESHPLSNSSLYMSPGQLSADGHQVSESASIDELVSAVRGDRTAA